MDSPTTVRGWLETLPEPYRTSAIDQMNCENRVVETITDALLSFNEWSRTEEGNDFWQGFYLFYWDSDIQIGQDDPFYKGHAAAKAAFERQKTAIVPEPESEIRYYDTVVGTTNANIGDVVTFGLNRDEPDHQPAFMVIAPDDLAELQRKAAAYDSIVAAFRELEDKKEKARIKFLGK